VPNETYTYEKRTTKENYFYVFDGGKKDGGVCRHVSQVSKETCTYEKRTASVYLMAGKRMVA